MSADPLWNGKLLACLDMKGKIVHYVSLYSARLKNASVVKVQKICTGLIT